MDPAINGSSTTPARAAASSPVNTVHAIQVFRIDEGQTVHLRTLSDSYGGLFTHWYRGRSVYCPGVECASVVHKISRIWKGYAAVEIYVEQRKKWMPWVLEISEHLELDLRNRFERGQVWEIFRDVPTNHKAQPVQGKLHEQRDASTFPAAFDVRPVLMHLYHIPAVDLSHKNPMPPRVIVEESDGAPPAILATAGAAKPLVSDEEVKRRLDDFFKKQKTPTEKKAAKP